MNLTPGALWCVLGDLPDNELPSDEVAEVARQSLEKSPTKKVAPSKPHPLADEGDDDDEHTEHIKHHSGESDQPEAQAGPSVPINPPPVRDTETHAHPDPVLPTTHSLASLNESMVTSLSSITVLFSVSNTTATTHQIAMEVSQLCTANNIFHCGYSLSKQTFQRVQQLSPYSSKSKK